MLNFLTGIDTDLYAPSLPYITEYFQVNMSLVKDTIAITMVGFSLGCIVFGVMIDIIGRRKTILMGLSAYIITSLIAISCTNVMELMGVRFIQGMMVASVSIGARALVADHFKGKEFTIAITYTSLGYGIGPVVAPFIGGMLQYYFGWRSNFLAYALFGCLLLILLFLLVQESFYKKNTFSLGTIVKNYKNVFSCFSFMSGIFILSLAVIEQLLFPTIGPFLIEGLLHHSVLIYGDAALVIGLSYFLGALANRFLISCYSKKKITTTGIYLLIAAFFMQYILSVSLALNLWDLILPLVIIYFSLGLIFPNVLATCLAMFPNSIGVSSSVQACTLTAIGGVGIAIISMIHVANLRVINLLYFVLILMQILVYFLFFRGSMGD